MSYVDDDLSQGGSLLAPEVWAAGKWAELTVSPRRFSHDTAHRPEVVALRQAIREFATAAVKVGHALFAGLLDGFNVMAGAVADWARSIGLLADAAAEPERRSPPIRAMDHRRLSKAHPINAHDRRPMYRTFGGREGRRGR